MSQNNDNGSQRPEWVEQLGSLMKGGESLDEGQVTIQYPDGSEPLTVSRRDFLRVASVAAASAGLGACRVPKDYVAPYVDRPEEIYHGVPNTFSSICQGCASQCGTLLTVREGRVSKLEGNPAHPISQGALCSRGQAATIDAYSPDRLTTPLKVGRKKDIRPEAQDGKMLRWEEINEAVTKLSTTWEELDKAVSGAIAQAGKVRLLTGATMTGPGRKKLVKDFLAGAKDGKHVVWEPMANVAGASAHAQAYGESFLPFYRFDKATAIVSFGSEFLDTAQGSMAYTRQFASTRDPDKSMSHLTVFEGRMTLTGGAADERHRVRTSDLLYVALAVAHELIIAGGVGGALASDPNVKATLGGYAADKIAGSIGVKPEAIKAAAAKLKEAGAKGLAVAHRNGSGATGARLEAVTALINDALGAVGSTVEHTRVFAGVDFKPVEELITELNSGAVDVLIIAGLNPVYDMPAALKFGEAMGKAKTIVVVDTLLTETAACADWVAAADHFLECWGDSESTTGVYTIQQPGMVSLNTTRGLEDSLIAWSAAAGNKAFAGATTANAGWKDKLRRPAPGAWYYYLRDVWVKEIKTSIKSPVSDEQFWEAIVRKGAWQAPGTAREQRRFNTAALKAIAGARPEKAAGALELELYATPAIYDGRQASNGVLLEVPDTVTKLCWDNYVCVSPKRFQALGLTRLGETVTVKAESGELVLPAMLVPGMHDDVVAVPVGYGHTHAGIVGSGIGKNGFLLAGKAEAGPGYTGLKVEASNAGGFEEVGMARGAEHVIDNHGRHIVPMTTTGSYAKHKNAGAHMELAPGFWDVHKYPTLKWGMSIDLSRCTGCAACVTACVIENNTPIVGKMGVQEGRLMHWLRIDRYYALPKLEDGGEKSSYDDEMLTDTPLVAAADYLENPQMLIQPMMCQHCDNAPCETVCPVAATTHSDDGLNTMTYNRCVGTRYCANNCPYKARRFNWYNYNTDRSDEFIADVFPEVTELANLNAKWPTQLRWSPEVTVRARGVMEKCTFCVQRLRHHTKTKRKLGIAPKEEVQTACQQTCPAEAISFGNTVDEKSSVHAGYHSERAFQVLSHIGVKPAVRYLTRVRHGEADAHDDAHGAAAGHGEGQKAGDGHKAGEGQKAGHGGEGQKAAPAGQH